jgi:hypothetical protein
VGKNVDVKEEALASGLSSRNNHVLVETFIFFVEWNDDIIPKYPFVLDWVEVVIEALAVFRELDLGLRFPVTTEPKFVFIKTSS